MVQDHEEIFIVATKVLHLEKQVYFSFLYRKKVLVKKIVVVVVFCYYNHHFIIAFFSSSETETGVKLIA